MRVNVSSKLINMVLTNILRKISVVIQYQRSAAYAILLQATFSWPVCRPRSFSLGPHLERQIAVSVYGKPNEH